MYREKVIEFLQETAEYFRECRSNASPASKAGIHFLELQNAANEVAELLKEQEPKPVKVVKNAYNEDFYFCPNCDRQFYGFYKRPLYCDRCGQAVKWNDI